LWGIFLRRLMDTSLFNPLVDALNGQVEQMRSLEIVLWVLIGLLGVCALVVVIYIIPMLLQLTRTLKEGEKAAKRVNDEIMPKVVSMVDEAEPAVKGVLGLLSSVVNNLGAVISGLKMVGGLFGRKKNK